ncbi:Glycosyltransferase involved in LPS biosynthesis, GR25 family [Devosia enhydra]|uniref:Glycosyltransferase involved in LPS biosynthesis, GR25 family n=1 Tax=Devosia enhydra TaxID=665118 RepID=A0A1K2HZ33_9HYPH|nr:glycosyltransferase family 25 protein [Devosia enhydra]SFZ85386.1 Glycosyltransferase involved in LPS biosynthesis, GR25 family [Devosia enhydra]
MPKLFSCYINLATRPDRRSFIEEQLTLLGLEARRIEATTPERVPADIARRHCVPDNPLGLARSELACTMSHLEAWSLFLVSDADRCLVIEDDADLSNCFVATLRDLLNADNLPSLVKLDAVDGPRRLGEPEARLGRFQLRRMYSVTHNTTCYLIDRATAANLLGERSYLGVPIDLALFDPYGPLRRRLRPYQLVPGIARARIAEQRPGDPIALSDIASTRASAAFHARSAKGLSLTWRRLVKGAAAELNAGSSKFMQDYVLGIRKHHILFVDEQ